MKYILILIAIPFLALAQEFEFVQEFETIPVEIYGWQVEVPWSGGYSRSSIRFCDIDGDSTFDLFIGNYYGDIHYFQNIGTQSSPLWEFQIEPFANVNLSGPPWGGKSKPCFGDLDADGDFDLLVGDGNGWVHYYSNEGNSQFPLMVFIIDSLEGVGYYCWNPELVDINSDGDLDLFGGVFGNVSYFENVGNAQTYEFQQVTLNFENIDVGNYACPRFVDIDSDGDYDLFVGNGNGNIWYYHNDGTPAVYNFADPIENWLGIDVGDYASPEFCDLDGDGDYDLFIGKDNDSDYSIPGAIHYWQNTGTPQSPNFIEITQSYLTFDIGHGFKPEIVDLDSDGDFDFLFKSNYYIGWMENTGNLESPQFNLQSYNLLTVPPGGIDLGDLDADGDSDLLTNDGWSGEFYIWENVSTPGNVQFVQRSQFSYDDILYEHTLGDVNGDSLLDLVAGAFDSQGGEELLLYYENQGTTQSPDFVLISEHFQNLTYDCIPNPQLVDFDFDGDLDFLLYICEGGSIWYYENVGTATSMQLELTSTNLLQDSLVLFNVDCADIDSDEDMDVFTGHYDGGCRFFRNITGQNEVGPRRPDIPYPKLDFAIGPNPANPVTWISFSLPAPQEATLAVYNILGAKVTTLASDLHMPGTHNIIWNASQYSSGVYIICLETPQYTSSQRVMVVK